MVFLQITFMSVSHRKIDIEDTLNLVIYAADDILLPTVHVVHVVPYVMQIT